MNSEIEKLFITKFVLKNTRDRVLGMLEKPKKREKLRTLLPHSALFDPKWVCHIPKNQQHADDIYQTLQHQHAPETCYLISSSHEFDGMELPLKDALDRIVGQLIGGTIIICLPEHLAYFEGEKYGDRYIVSDRF